MPTPPRTLLDALRRHAGIAPDRPAILAIGRRPLGYAALVAQIEGIGAALRSFGVARGDHVAVVLTNGPEAAVACLGVAAYAVCAPLNPALGVGELAFCFSDLDAKAVVLASGTPSSARSAAERLGIPVIELHVPADAPAGVFRLVGEPAGGVRPVAAPSGPGDRALVLYTSGTTSRPKRVALTHRNIEVAASATAAVLELTTDDRSLNILPVFHVHGLIGAVLAPLVAGGSVVCSLGFAAAEFFDWVAATQPTWFTAVPTIHQAILARARLDAAAAGAPPGTSRHRLRFVRSASSALPVSVLHELERVFAAPLIETYGMTEASPIIACNPLPPRQRKPGSVGLPVAAEVALLADDGRLHLARERRASEPVLVGEIAIRGDNVITSYDGATAMSAHAFVDGWLRTGDLGYFDDDGYLYVTGRRKEIINRGGEKIAPFEVEAVLLEHPAVEQAAAFAIRDAVLGEAVGAAVVCRRGLTVDADELLRFAAGRLAEFKLPQHVSFTAELPRNASGKVVRADLARHFAVEDGRSGGAGTGLATAETTSTIRSIFAQVLRVPEAVAGESFFAIGGDSAAAVIVRMRVEQAFGVVLSLQTFYAAPTAAELAARIDSARAGGAVAVTSTIPSAPRSAAMATSPHQDRWLAVHLKYPRFSGMNVSWARIEGVIDVERLLASVKRVIARHEIFGTTFEHDGARFTQAIAPGSPIEVPYFDLRAADLAETKRRLDQHVDAELAHAFNFRRPPLWRISVLRAGDDEHFLLLNIHHALCDYASKRLLCEEIARCYDAASRGRAAELPALPIQYVDFAAWHGPAVAAAGLPTKAEFWRAAFAGSPTVSLFVARDPAASASPIIPVYATIDRETVVQLRRLAAAERVSVFSIVQLAFLFVWRDRLGGVPDDFLYNAMATTSRDRRELVHLVGTFAGSIAIRFRLPSDEQVRAALQRLHAINTVAIEHEVPVSVLRAQLGAAAMDKNRTRIAFNFFQVRAEPSDPDGLRVNLEFRRPYRVLREPAGDGELVIYLMELPSGELIFNFSRREGDFDTAAFDVLVAQLRRALERFAADVAALDAPVVAWASRR